MDPIQSQNDSPLFHEKLIYDAFLSFRGEDTRKTFVSHLDKALLMRGVYTFKDNRKLEVGDSIPEELSSAIRMSRCAVVVISENYATSSWCLEELRLIMELQGEKKIKVVPIFYGVDPSDVRHQRGNFVLDKYQGPEMAGKVLVWREALTDIANRKGMESEKCEDDAAMIEAIVQKISSRLLTMSPIAFDDIVGMETHMESLRPLLDMKSKDDARIIGITGMGGMGKTTIAKYLYEQLKLSFSPHTYFMENVANLSEKCGLVKLQLQLLSSIFGEDNLKLERVDYGIQQLEYRLRHVKVFLVLDNVDNENQLSALAKETRWFAPGSRIIITTRDKSLLQSCGVKYVYDVKPLDDDEARELLKKVAFRGGRLPLYDYYKGLSDCVIRLAKGLPLALEALGTSLCGKPTWEWMYYLESLETVPNSNLGKILKRSCASLDEPGKTALHNISYLLNGDPLWRVTTLLEGGEHWVEILAEKSLIDIYADGRIIVHDLVKENVKDTPTQKRILRHADEVNRILADKEGTLGIEGVVLDVSEMHHGYLIDWKPFEQMLNLSFLIIYEGLNSRRHRI